MGQGTSLIYDTMACECDQTTISSVSVRKAPGWLLSLSPNTASQSQRSTRLGGRRGVKES